jgi:hypothetical protein
MVAGVHKSQARGKNAFASSVEVSLSGGRKGYAWVKLHHVAADGPDSFSAHKCSGSHASFRTIAISQFESFKC